MNNKLKSKILKMTKELSDIPVGKNRHFTFFVKRNKILSIGWNDYDATHPKCEKHGYGKKHLHSELSALIRFKGDYSDLNKYCLINTRINRFNKLGMSKPCEVCSILIEKLGFKKVYYTDINGEFSKL